MVKDPRIAHATSGGRGSYKRVYRYEARNVRDQEGKMRKAIAGRK